MRRKPGDPLSRAEEARAVKLLGVLLPLSENERLDLLALVIYLLWDGRLERMLREKDGTLSP
jgi:hypothetical protein